VRSLNEEICPAFVVVTQAPEPLCRARWNARGTKTESEFASTMQQYTKANLDEATLSLSDFFQDMAKVGVLNLPVAGRDEEDIFESTRIYMEKTGRPFNYLALEEEVAEEILARRAEREEQAESERQAEEAKREAGDDGEQQREAQRHEERLRVIAGHLEERKALQELPLREYLMRYMVPSLTEGLIEVCKVLPENPVDYLATYLEEHAAAEWQGEDL